MAPFPQTSDFQSRFPTLDSSLASELADRFGSPVYLFDIQGMLNWFDRFQSAARSRYSHSSVAVSVKTNPLAGLLLRLFNHGALAEVISGSEYQLAKHLQIPDSRIVFNGPAKNDSQLREAILGEARVHCDHPDEVDRIEEIARQENLIAPIGLRIYQDRPENFNRFGFAIGDNLRDCEATEAVKRICQSPHLTFAGIHSHIGTNIRDLSRFRQLGHDLNDYAMFIRGHFGFDLRWINVGGGLAGISPTNAEAETVDAFPVACPEAYTDAVITPLLPVLESSTAETQLLFEPGRALFDPWGAILTTVVGRRPSNRHSEPAVILDAGITHLALSEKFNHPIHICKEAEDPSASSQMTRFLGPTCMQRDEVHRPCHSAELERGDHVVIYGAGGYSMTLAIPFVNYRAGVVGWEGDEFNWLRKPETLEHKMRLEDVGLTSEVQA